MVSLIKKRPSESRVRAETRCLRVSKSGRPFASRAPSTRFTGLKGWTSRARRTRYRSYPLTSSCTDVSYDVQHKVLRNIPEYHE